jgi:HD-GYP domain-containing protein (c-di-GMP phosphodiesterase class II)
VVKSALESLLDDVVAEELGSERLRRRFLEVMTAVEEKDHFINRHSESVADLARRTAETLGLESTAIETIETAAIVHDIGKSRVPEAILGKRGRLSSDEWALVKRYPEFSAEILERFEHLGPVVPVVLHHQERWDGTGYPRSLAGDEIPIGAQIVGICDVYDVLTSDRAYRPALPSDIARRTIEGGIDRLWNPIVAEVFLKKVLGG